MKYFFGKEVKDTLLIRNKDSNPNFVMLLPVTRVGARYEATWRRIIEVVDKSNANALVVIDKTPNGEASEFFQTNFELSGPDLYVARRDLSEAIHDSQGFINLDENLWILQVHDDDEWDGILRIPENADKLEYFEVEFFIEEKSGKRKTGADDSPPARVVFSLLPSLIWNRFAEFIQQEGGHVAGSVDSTLNLVTRLSCKRSQISGFTYTYDNRHWEDRKVATKHLEVLASQDGWTKLTSVEISLVNRTIDGLAALAFFGKYIPVEVRREAQINLLKLFEPSARKRLLVVTRYLAFPFAHVLLKGLGLVIRTKSIQRLSEYFARSRDLDKVLQQTWRIESLSDVITLINQFQDSGDFPLLENRFRFWKEQFTL